jgi:ATP-dependent DNA helicase RecG
MSDDHKSVGVELLQQWMDALEGEHFEFKEAKHNYNFEKLVQYCCALANEGGGRIIFGVTDKRPRKVVGTQAFPQPENTRRSLSERLFLRINFLEIQHPLGRVVVFEIPSRPIGVAIKYEGIYWGRIADSLVALTEERLRVIFDESGHDFSADVCAQATFADLEPVAVETFRKLWIAKSGNANLASISAEQLLVDSELLYNGKPTWAAMILFGKRESLGKMFGQAEVIFEYRSAEISGPAQQRREFRQGFFTFHNELWELINQRNDLQHYQDGLFIRDIPTFAERTVREALLNAVTHRNYQLGGSVFIRQYAQKIVIESPGGFPYGITIDNIIDRQNPRNRRLAEAFARCGLVERSGQGVNLMFEQSIQQGKLPPDFTGTDQYGVTVTLNGLVLDVQFLEYLQKISDELQVGFTTHDFIFLDHLHRDIPIPEQLKERSKLLLDCGVIERITKSKFILSKRFYLMTGQKGTYTRKKGLDRETNKQLLLKHITENADHGVKMEEFLQILPEYSRNQIKVLLREIQKENIITCVGSKRGSLWFPKS